MDVVVAMPIVKPRLLSPVVDKTGCVVVNPPLVLYSINKTWCGSFVNPSADSGWSKAPMTVARVVEPSLSVSSVIL